MSTHVKCVRSELPIVVASLIPIRCPLTYGKFVAEPFERGFGTTVGNSLRRVLLSSPRVVRLHRSKSAVELNTSLLTLPAFWKTLPTSCSMSSR
ncbi:MAG: hypothetical protein R3C56_18425 [Pirellulaceae bacterium]